MTNITLFGQIMQTLDRFSLTKLVGTPQSDKHHKGINTWTHLVTMLFCQFSKLNSLRDVCNGLKAASGNLNHLGVGRAPCRSSLFYQNKHRGQASTTSRCWPSSRGWPSFGKPAFALNPRFYCWIPRPLACVWACMIGLNFAARKEPLNFIPCRTMMGACRSIWIWATGRPMTPRPPKNGRCPKMPWWLPTAPMAMASGRKLFCGSAQRID